MEGTCSSNCDYLKMVKGVAFIDSVCAEDYEKRVKRDKAKKKYVLKRREKRLAERDAKKGQNLGVN